MNVLAALAAHYGRLRARGEVAPCGYSRERIAFALVLCDAGTPVAVSPLSNGSAQSAVAPLCEVPHPVRRTSSPSANFLYDKTAYVFGMKWDPATRMPRPAVREHRAFAALHERLLAHSGDEGLEAPRGVEWGSAGVGRVRRLRARRRRRDSVGREGQDGRASIDSHRRSAS